VSTVIWHNPRCSKSRQTLALLTERGAAPVVRLYLTDAPSEAELRDVAARLSVAAIDLIRRGEELFRELGLSPTDPDAVLFAAMAANPKLIERPVVLRADKAAIGRPPEAALDIL